MKGFNLSVNKVVVILVFYLGNKDVLIKGYNSASNDCYFFEFVNCNRMTIYVISNSTQLVRKR